ncbi:hypothetical protein TWF569_010093 [Orbilia oligospora]|nr:hypothetical protein TWF706_003673 [Orbilia oligospora]KAF3091410.1 hypothetical protein TWF103_011668 [Orbilia oligospora]KAF3125567.1 hypothetical protein TWF594_001559 [Orbilia oligospora]KAF3134829.1 hypothetical protein TWF569_010093 [Orbilia oligospora]KAF3158860.1 hypothetical protein TWF751_001235 [Orbilia oligospora]
MGCESNDELRRLRSRPAEVVRRGFCLIGTQRTRRECPPFGANLSSVLAWFFVLLAVETMSEPVGRGRKKKWNREWF